MEDKVSQQIDELADDMKDSLMELLTYPAIGPDNGGGGEMRKAEFLLDHIDDFGFDTIERYDAPDERVSSGYRPNIVAVKEGRTDKDLIMLAHLDVVPEGDLEEWDTDPFDPVFKDGKIYGRGAEDNGQAVISSIYTAKALTLLDKTPRYNLKVILVSDEETGNEYGIKHILDEYPFTGDDLVIVPDHSEEKGKKIEITEKSSLWVKITVNGKQGHAASPGSALNANRVAAEYTSTADKRLHENFDEEDDLFAPPVNTLEPTKREANVPNVNTIPGREVQYFDCRILPSVPLDAVKHTFEEVADEVSKKTDADIQIDYIREKSAPEGTPEDAEVVIKLKAAVEDVAGFTPGLAGIGGGTVASHFRREGIPAAVWITNDEMAHMSNEYAVLDYMVRDCKVFTSILLD